MSTFIYPTLETTVAPLAWRQVDLCAVAANVSALVAHCAPAELMVVVKADAYSHGSVEVARIALAAGARRLGVATLAEGLELRQAGITAPVLAWLAGPHSPYKTAIRHDLELAAYSCMQLESIAQAAREAKRRAVVHLKAETGMWRGGASDEWTSLVTRACELETTGDIEVVGIWSHLARADEPDDLSTDAQRDAFEHAVDTARVHGLRPRMRHLANSAATLTRADLHYEMVRCGLAVYGVNPLSDRPSPVPLKPAMTVRATVVHVKNAPTGVGVSYGHTYRTETATRLALLPLGYADGLPVLPAPHPPPFGHRGVALQLAGRVCMDQTVADIGTHPIDVGDTVVVLGPGDDGEWTAEDWAHGSGRSAYDILTGLGRRRMGLKYVDNPNRYSGYAERQ